MPVQNILFTSDNIRNQTVSNSTANIMLFP
jgi:hypothetical protein